MYTVDIENDGEKIVINSPDTEHRVSGTYTKAKNKIPSCTFNIYPDNPGYNKLSEYKTLVRIYDPTAEGEEQQKFGGRIILIEGKVDSTGFYKTVTCEGWLGYFKDTINYLYSAINGIKEDIPVNQVVTQFVRWHNENCSEEHAFDIDTFATTDTIEEYSPSADKSSFDALTDENLTKYLNYDVKEYLGKDGNMKRKLYCNEGLNKAGDTIIRLGENMQSLTVTNNFDNICTRVIPTTKDGALMGTLGIDTIWVDDAEAIKKFGVITKMHTFDYLNTTKSLASAGKNWLNKNSKVKRTITVNCSDLFDLGTTPDSFEVYSTYLIDCSELGISERLELTQLTRDINETWNTQLTFGEILYSARSYKSLK